MLIDPTRDLTAPQPWGFRGPTLTIGKQRDLFRRWTSRDDVHPHEAFVGLAALLHGATTRELQHLTDTAIDHNHQQIQFGTRPHPTPLDPSTWTALNRCLDHRNTMHSTNPHVLITMQTKATHAPPSDTYIKRTLRAVDIQPRILRSTRLLDLVATNAPKLVASTYGMTNDAITAYLADATDTGRLPNP
ncbi:MAG: hypothetical protein J2P17_00530 [Mycobacterium sp.]|nr:hypothetical protein [Mycobacterium sp.]